MNENAKKWVKALRSRKYPQCYGQLHRERKSFCCLGVACEEYAKANKLKPKDVYRDNLFNLPTYVQKWLGIQWVDGHFDVSINNYDSLSGLNDSAGFDFDKIADVIESEPKGLFGEAQE